MSRQGRALMDKEVGVAAEEASAIVLSPACRKTLNAVASHYLVTSTLIECL